MGGWVDAIVNPVNWLAGEGLKAAGVRKDFVDPLQNPISSIGGALATPNTAAPSTPVAAPPPPTPSDPVVAAAMGDASKAVRKRSSGRAATYLVGKNSPGLLDQPGTFFKSSLGG